MAQFKNHVCLLALIAFSVCLTYISALPVPQDDNRYQNWKDMEHELLAVPSNTHEQRVPPPPGFSSDNSYNRVRRSIIPLAQFENFNHEWKPEDFQHA